MVTKAVLVAILAALFSLAACTSPPPPSGSELATKPAGACVCLAEGGEAACRAGTCVVTRCRRSFADCNGAYADGCEVDLASTPTHCGACGNACASGTCKDGSCEDVHFLARGQLAPHGVIASGEDVFWVNRAEGDVRVGSVMKLAAGAVLSPLADLQSPSGGLVLDGEYLYWENGGSKQVEAKTWNFDGSIRRVARTGGPIEDVAGGIQPVEGLAVDASHVYFVGVRENLGGSGGVYVGALLQRVPKVGGLRETLAEVTLAERPAGINFGRFDESVFWVTEATGDVSRVAASGGAPKIALSSSLPDGRHLVVDASGVYWASGTGDALRVMRCAPGGGPAEALWAGQGVASGLALDETSVYLAHQGDGAAHGAIVRIDKVGKGAKLQVGALELPTSVSVDAASVYFTTRSGLVARVVKQ